MSCTSYHNIQCVLLMLCFFKQKTADEVRISDWSSDVCSSDLGDRGQIDAARPEPRDPAEPVVPAGLDRQYGGAGRHQRALSRHPRSEARRVGKEGVSTCGSRWSKDHYIKKQIESKRCRHPNNIAESHNRIHEQIHNTKE